MLRLAVDQLRKKLEDSHFIFWDGNEEVEWLRQQDRSRTKDLFAPRLSVRLERKLPRKT